MKLGLVEVNDIRDIVDHKGEHWIRAISKNGQYYWQAEHSEKYQGHCEMVAYVKQSLYHNYRDVATSGHYINVRKRKKAKFVEVEFDKNDNLIRKNAR